MKKFLILAIIILPVSIALFTLLPVHSSEINIETFSIPCKNIRLAIESYKEKNDWTPLVLSLGNLELHLWLSKDGLVRERKEDILHQLPPVFRINMDKKQLLLEKRCYPFVVYEQDRVRTRMRLIEKNIRVRLEINNLDKEAALFIGENKLKLFRLRGPAGCMMGGVNKPALRGLSLRMTDHYFPLADETYSQPQAEHEEKKISPGSVRARVISPAERAALIALYNSTNGAAWTKNGGWKEPPLEKDGFAAHGTEDDWYGIDCNNANSTVERIELPDNNLLGSIPPELADLANLQILDLSENELSGSIPAELGNLVNLGSLFLHANRLTGYIPGSLGNMTRLGNLFLHSNRLTGSIPAALGNLTNLSSLRLDANQLTGRIPAGLSDLSDLLYLNLSENELEENIPKELGQLTGLVSLYLSSNRLTGSIPVELSNLTALTSLCLDANELTGEIPLGITDLQNLYLLQLQDNSLEGALPAEIDELENLEYCYINGNKLKDAVPTSITELNALSDADLGYNALFSDDENVKEFLKNRDPDWQSTQTIAPGNLTARVLSNTVISLTWKPIAYTQDTGHYQVLFRKSPVEPFSFYDITADKRTAQMTIKDLLEDTTYYFVVETRTAPHDRNKNTVVSNYSLEVSAKTSDIEYMTVAGTIKEPEGKEVAGVFLTFSNFGGSAISDSMGNYSHKVVNGWSGIVKPEKTDYFFSPASRIYSNLGENKEKQDYTAMFKMIRTFHVVRRQENAWLVRRDYAAIDIYIKYPEYAAGFRLYRKQVGGAYQMRHRFLISDLQQGDYSYNDTYIDHDTSYTYKLEAFDSAETIIAVSGEQTI